MDQNATALDAVPPLSPVTSDTEPSIDDFDTETAAAAIRNVPHLNRPYSAKLDDGRELPALQIANGDPDGLDPIAEDDLDPGSFDLVMPVDEPGDRTHARRGSNGSSGPRKSRLEHRSELLFSRHHLQAIFADPAQLHRFSSFLCRYRPASVPLLDYYIVAIKALRAIRYSNSVLARLRRLPDYEFTHTNNSQQENGASGGGGSQQAPLTVNRALLDRAAAAFDVLTHEDLPAYVTHVWIRTVSVSIRQRVMGRVGNDTSSEGLAEVFCLTDPSRPDNPIVFMSEQFNRTTQYGVDYVIGRNCRFLQGPCTNPFSVKRIRDKLEAGIEHYETFLNYRRDGSPFVNLIMLAPLYDSKGKIRYHIGAQVDVSGLAMSSYDLGALEKLVDEDPNLQAEDLVRDNSGKDALTEFAEILAPRELDVIGAVGGRMHRLPLQVEDGLRSYEKIQFSSGHGNEESSTSSHHHRRSVSKNRVVIRDGDSQNSSSDGKEDEEENGKNNDNETMKPSAMQDTPIASTAASLSLHHNGRLTGVYEHYLLVRPYPSLRILFTSPSMRVPGILQSPLLDRIGGSSRMRSQLVEALSGGQSVTAKIKWLSIGNRKNRAMPLGRRAAVAAAQQQQRKARFDNSHTGEGQSEDGPSTSAAASESLPGSEQAGRSRWLHCTPLMGAHGKVGVWMIVLVDDDEDEDGSDAKTKARRRGGIVAPIIQTQAQQQQSRRAQSVMSNQSFGSIGSVVGEGREMEAAAAAEDKYDEEMMEEWQQRMKRSSFENLGQQRAEQPRPPQPQALPALALKGDEGNLGFASHTAARKGSIPGTQQRMSKAPRMSAFRSGGGAGGSAARFFRLDALSRASRGHQNASKQRRLSAGAGFSGGVGGDDDQKKGQNDDEDANGGGNLDKKNDVPSSNLSRVLPRQVPRTPPWLPRRGRSVIVVPDDNDAGGGGGNEGGNGVENEGSGNKDGSGSGRGSGDAGKQRTEEDDMSSLYSKASVYTVRI